MRYFTSDFHFGHKNILKFERGDKFNSIDEHDKYIMQLMKTWSNKLKPGDEWYNLGDWGNTDYLFLVDMLRAKGIKTIFVYGNHDSVSDLEKFEKHFDKVYQYPFYLSDKLCISHIPQGMYEDQLNIHGHIHASTLKSDNHFCVSLATVNYTLISEKAINNMFAKLPKYQRKFLWEPFAELYCFNRKDRDDVVYNPKTKMVDLSASRLLQKQKKMRDKDWNLNHT
jgi:calcineurin-like phosphoesterase family protein